MVLAFLDNKGRIYANQVPKGTLVNTNYIVVEALSKFMKIYKK